MGLSIISAKEVSTYVKEKDAILVDLRSEEDYREYHIRGAVNIPAERLSRFMMQSDRNRIHVFYCRHGSLSIQEGRKYARRGFRICSVAGGIEGYVSAFHS